MSTEGLPGPMLPSPTPSRVLRAAARLLTNLLNALSSRNEG